jgi:hypothetical protein
MIACRQGIQHWRNTNQNQGEKGEQRTSKWVPSKHNSKIMEQACGRHCKYECGSVMDQKQICRLQFQVDLSIPVGQGWKTKLGIACMILRTTVMHQWLASVCLFRRHGRCSMFQIERISSCVYASHPELRVVAVACDTSPLTAHCTVLL